MASAAPKLPARAAQSMRDDDKDDDEDDDDGPTPLREREYPALGCDSYGAYPDDAQPYAGETYADAPAATGEGAST